MSAIRMRILLALGVCLMATWAGRALAQETENSANPPGKPTQPADTVAGKEPTPEEAAKAKLGFDLSAAYVTKYMWRGFDILDDHGAFQPSATYNLFDTGLSVNVWGSWGLGGGGDLDELDELDYTGAYNHTFFAEEAYAVNVGVNYIYYNLYRTNKLDDTMEVGGSLALPNLIPLGPSHLVPKYYYGYLWPAESADINDAVDGSYHNFALTYELPLPKDLTLGFLGDIAYNDGQFGVDHDWSHSTLGVSLSIPVGPVEVTPFVNYQISMEETVNPDDELYGGITASLSF